MRVWITQRYLHTGVWRQRKREDCSVGAAHILTQYHHHDSDSQTGAVRRTDHVAGDVVRVLPVAFVCDVLSLGVEVVW